MGLSLGWIISNYLREYEYIWDNTSKNEDELKDINQIMKNDETDRLAMGIITRHAIYTFFKKNHPYRMIAGLIDSDGRLVSSNISKFEEMK